MARPCTVCSHPKREEIDKGLVAGDVGLRKLAKLYGASVAAIWRHQQNHLPGTLARGLASLRVGESGDPAAQRIAEHHVAVEAKKDAHGIDTLAQLRAINGACLEVLRNARSQGKSEVLLRAVDRIARQIELQAKLLGMIENATVVNLAIAPEWQGLRQRILDALRPYPEAQQAVALSLRDSP